MKKGIFIVTTMIAVFLFSGCTNIGMQLPVIALQTLGSEGNLSEEKNGFQILENLGVHSLSVRALNLKKFFPAHQALSIKIEGTEYSLTRNVFDPELYEVDLPESHGIEAIRNGKLSATVRKSAENSLPRADISIGSVVLNKDTTDNGSSLYQIEAGLYTSMRNANVFVFTAAGVFIPPSYILSSEGNCYTTENFISARNASADSSINGTFAYLKSLPNHASLLQVIYPNIVTNEGGTIVITPPTIQNQRLLKELGAEGNLSIAGNVYNIIDNTASTGVWSVTFKKSRLPEPEKSGTEWKLILKGKEYVFTQNPFETDIFERNIPDTETTNIEEIRNCAFSASEGSVTPVTPSTPNLTSPINGATALPLQTQLQWQACTGNAPITYDVYFGSATTPPLAASNLSVFNWNTPVLNANTTYYWKVIAKNTAGTASSVVRTFTTGSSSVGSAITFQDANLEAAIRHIIGKSSGPIYSSDVLWITRLDIEKRNIASLEGLQFLTNLQSLDFERNQVSNISPLASLLNLQFLDFCRNVVSDITPLVGLINLKMIEFGWNQVSSISALVNNTGIASGDKVDVCNNLLDLSVGSQARQDIQTLLNRGVSVDYH